MLPSSPQKPAFLEHSLEHRDLIMERRLPRFSGSLASSPPRSVRGSLGREEARLLKGCRVGKLLVILQAHARLQDGAWTGGSFS